MRINKVEQGYEAPDGHTFTHSAIHPEVMRAARVVRRHTPGTHLEVVDEETVRVVNNGAMYPVARS